MFPLHRPFFSQGGTAATGKTPWLKMLGALTPKTRDGIGVSAWLRFLIPSVVPFDQLFWLGGFLY